MGLAYVDELAKNRNGVEYFLVRQDLFDKTLNAKGIKTKDSKEMARAFLTKNTMKTRRRRI